MKTTLVFAIIVGSAFAAPTNDIQESERSAAYGAPCAAAAAAAPSMGPVALYLTAPAAPQALIPNYREDDHKEEHMEHARSYYDSSPVAAAVAAAAASGPVSPAGAGAAGAGAALALPALAPAGPAVGLFPNAKVGNCAVPLLLSCAPRVVSGHLAGHSYYGSAYRAGESDHHKEMREIENNKVWAEPQRAASNHPLEVQEEQASHHHHGFPSDFHHQPHHHTGHPNFAHQSHNHQMSQNRRM